MKRIIKAALMLFVPLLAAFAIYDFYDYLPIEGAYDTSPVDYPQIDRNALKTRLSCESTKTLEQMRGSGLEVVHWQGILDKVDATVISEVVPQSDPFFAREHYPYDEVFDEETQSLYYYHSHRPKEHGHFHLFFCDSEILDQYEPLSRWSKKNSSVHLLAVSIHPDGTPLGLFTTNQWVTPKEWWYSAQTISDLVGHFEITHSYPSYPTNQWLTHLLKLFKPQIDDILFERDAMLAKTNKPLETVLKDKSKDVLSQVSISIETQLEVIDEILQERAVGQKATE